MSNNKPTKRRDLRIIWSSNGMWTGSGYGIYSGMLLKRLKEDGWPLAHIAWYGLEGHPIELNGIKVYPKLEDVWGADALVSHSQHFGAHVAFTMQDVWALNPQHLQNMQTWIPYVPIDKDPLPPPVADKLRFAYKIISFSRFGKKVLEDAGFTSTLILEGTDTNVFKPMDKIQMKAELKLPPEKFVFGMIAANKENPPRKSFQEAMEAFKLFHDNHPDSVLLVHNQQISPGGFPIQQFAQHLGILDALYQVPGYIAIWNALSEEVNKEMNAMDVLLHPSQTEGFGLTVIEAQSAGTPVIIQDSHSMPELIVEGKTGWSAKTASKRFTNDYSWVNVPDVKSIHEAMEKAYRALQDNPEQVKKDCRQNIVDNYNLDTQFKELWVPMLEDLQEEIIPLQSK